MLEVLLDKIRNQKILMVGAGAIGSELALRLANLHVEQLTLVDGDTVSGENLNHALVFEQGHMERPKVEVLEQTIHARYPELRVNTEQLFIQQCSLSLFTDHDLIVCAPDNDQTRIWVNYHAVRHGKPVLYVGVGGHGAEWEGFLYFYRPRRSGCFVCFAQGGAASTLSYATVSRDLDFEESRHQCGGRNEHVPMLPPVVGVLTSYTSSLILQYGIEDDIPDYTHINLRQLQINQLNHVHPVEQCVICGTFPMYPVT